MSQFTREEQLGLLTRALERRLQGKNPYIQEMQNNIDMIETKRKEYTERIEKYKDDEIVVQILQAQLSEFDRQYTGTKQNYKMMIEEVIESEPKVKQFLKLLGNKNRNKDILYLMLDLFFEATLTDWNEMEQDQKENEDGKAN